MQCNIICCNVIYIQIINNIADNIPPCLTCQNSNSMIFIYSSSYYGTFFTLFFIIIVAFTHISFTNSRTESVSSSSCLCSTIAVSYLYKYQQNHNTDKHVAASFTIHKH